MDGEVRRMGARRWLAGAAALAVWAAAGSAPVRGSFVGDPHVYKVGAAVRDITPDGRTNLGGNGLGDGSVIPDAVVSRGHVGDPGSQHIAVRALVIDDGVLPPLVIADIETQGMFAAYKGGAYGLHDIAAAVSAQRGALLVDHMLLAADHTHSGPDTIGAWGFVPDAYMQRIKDAAVAAIVDAYDHRTEAELHFGQSRADDLVYDQNCTEALNQSPTPSYTGPSVCDAPDQDIKDAYVRVLQARAVGGGVVATLVSYNAHATLGGADGIHGDWPQFLSDAMSSAYGGVGIGMEGAVGRMQPCRPQCSFTDPAQFGAAADRRSKYLHALMLHVDDALAHGMQIWGYVAASQRTIREPITSPAVLALFAGGDKVGAELRRSTDAPWMVGPTVTTSVTSMVVGQLLLAGFPGEAYPNISVGVQAAVPGKVVVPLGLANDQLGYLISPAEAWPVVAAEVGVNDNSIFNVSQTIGDHVMCASIAAASDMAGVTNVPPRCAAFNALDAASSPV